MNLDVLVFAAHPDDAELSMGGTIAKFTKSDLKVGVIDFTKGELGTRGSAETRQKEAFQSAISLKLAIRENLHIPDGGVEVSKENITKVVMCLRKYRPKIIFAPYFNDRHPDHIDTSAVVKRAMFSSGLEKIKTFDKEKKQDAYRPGKLYYYMQTYAFTPSFIVDVSDTFEDKMNAVKAYATQFFNPKSVEPETFISQPNFMKFVESRAKLYGFKIGKDYGEPFYCEEDIEMDMVHLVKASNSSVNHSTGK
ncbi:MAG: bacillithiol biosynthesis deacetylase BshB1 [Ignavibacteria bacterium]|jgi:bacillithiol biosynthesis deacetylase BshB1|nr:bacillithiol biosynthesis deacetylase BshB1 [Ignavibacteria bacterium]HEX2962113.1 bacillithiol biosynthesis deacetylase BshB1 [Ignavibacteriales bacterium]MCU7499470.1 bacillithiol biosynthesis deacetylase BshB1 [Ignavibacteria bacterium]MCU7512699.1 bacillithiol biosynthesis deacetylase BshB1 [Ignavibacteria bacterium]MCU7521872.1 bacillithiol biosynthesis deacetylase BshB1 [Ignavibacteria bacterium]